MRVRAGADDDAGPRPRFFLVMGWTALAVALLGFARTFFAPLGQGTFEAPPEAFLHAGFTFGWVLLFATQPTLAAFRRYGAHKLLGAAGAVLAVGVAVTGVAVGAWAARRDFDAGGGPTAVSTVLGPVLTMGMFLGLVAAGVAFRRRPETHKRLMLLATILVLWPAWFRFRHYFPDVPRPELVFGVAAAQSLTVLAMLRDRLALGRIHPVLAWLGPILIVEQFVETLLFDSPPWRAVAGWIFAIVA